MPMFNVSMVGQFGVVTDIAPHEIPPNAWSSANNMHFVGSYAEKVLGYRGLFGGASVSPYFLTSVRPVTGAPFWVYAGDSAVYAYDSGHHNITRASGAYTSSAWQGGVMNGLLYLNNGADAPQIWSPAVNTQLLVDLPNWPAGTTAAVIRSFKNFMIAFDVTKPGGRDSRLIKWSHPAASGTYPTSWDETDATKDAAEYSLSETEGIIKDSLPLRDANIVYKDDSIWGMSYVGGLSIFRFFNVFRNVGVLAKNCVVEFQTGQHLVFARDDIFVHDGHTITPIIRNKARRRIYNSLDRTNLENSFVALDAANNEVWICFPETGHTYANVAMVWNWITNTTGLRDLPEAAYIGIGIADESAGDDTWASDTSTWASDSSSWGQTVSNPSQTRLVMAVPTGNKLYGLLPDTSDADGVPFDAVLQRTGLGPPLKDNTPPDFTSMKLCTGIWPKITGTRGGTVFIRLGVHNDFSEAPTWGSWKTYVIGTTKKIDELMTGRLFAIEFHSTSAIDWQLQGYGLDVQY